jgi:hypothetical protein
MIRQKLAESGVVTASQRKAHKVYQWHARIRKDSPNRKLAALGYSGQFLGKVSMTVRQEKRFTQQLTASFRFRLTSHFDAPFSHWVGNFYQGHPLCLRLIIFPGTVVCIVRNTSMASTAAAAAEGGRLKFQLSLWRTREKKQAPLKWFYQFSHDAASTFECFCCEIKRDSIEIGLSCYWALVYWLSYWEFFVINVEFEKYFLTF